MTISAQNVAIAISTDVYDKIGGVGTVGGIVGSTSDCKDLELYLNVIHRNCR